MGQPPASPHRASPADLPAGDSMAGDSMAGGAGAGAGASAGGRPGPTASKRCWDGGRVFRIDLEALVKRTPWDKLSKAELDRDHAEAGFTASDGKLRRAGKHYAAAWQACGKQRTECPLYAARLVQKQGKLKPQTKILLGKGWMSSDIVSLALFDIDVDGDVELLVHYRLETKPEAAVGSTYQSHLAIFSWPGMKLQGTVSAGSGGQATVHRACKVTLRRVDRLCTGRPQLIESSVCQAQVCDDQPSNVQCQDGPEYDSFLYAYDGQTDRYQKPVPLDVPAKAAAIRDGRPWAVIVASLAAGKYDARRHAEQQRRRLTPKGVPTEVVYSGTLSKLSAGYWVVLAGRFKTRPEATKLLRQLRAKKVKAYVKRAF
ncbi:MAG: SPOR domain-containing protein [bacterium]